MTGAMFERVGIAGLGLIGTSFGLALRARGLAGRVIGVDRDAAAITVARGRGAVDEGAADYAVLEGADLVIVAVPPQAVVDAALRAAGPARRGAVLFDVASVKAPIVRALEAALPEGVRFVGGHPMAGTERQGAAAADAALLTGRPFLITPTARSDADAVDVVWNLARGLGMRPLLLDPDVHDAIVAQVSHVPYLLAAAAVNAADDVALGLGGPAFESLRRMAGSPVELWVEICSQNRSAILRSLGWVRDELDRLEAALNEDTLDGLLTAARRRAGGGV